MKIEFLEKSEKEFLDSINYYNDQQDNLGFEFSNEVYRSIENIVKYPKAWSVFSKNTRRCLVNRFPYGVIYSEKKSKIIIIAIMHLHKKPDYASDRLK